MTLRVLMTLFVLVVLADLMMLHVLRAMRRMFSRRVLFRVMFMMLGELTLLLGGLTLLLGHLFLLAFSSRPRWGQFLLEGIEPKNQFPANPRVRTASVAQRVRGRGVLPGRR